MTEVIMRPGHLGAHIEIMKPSEMHGEFPHGMEGERINTCAWRVDDTYWWVNSDQSAHEGSGWHNILVSALESTHTSKLGHVYNVIQLYSKNVSGDWVIRVSLAFSEDLESKMAREDMFKEIMEQLVIPLTMLVNSTTAETVPYHVLSSDRSDLSRHTAESALWDVSSQVLFAVWSSDLIAEAEDDFLIDDMDQYQIPLDADGNSVDALPMTSSVDIRYFVEDFRDSVFKVSVRHSSEETLKSGVIEVYDMPVRLDTFHYGGRIRYVQLLAEYGRYINPYKGFSTSQSPLSAPIKPNGLTVFVYGYLHKWLLRTYDNVFSSAKWIQLRLSKMP